MAGIFSVVLLVAGAFFYTATAFAAIGETDISAQDSPIASSSVASACTKAKAAAAARGFSDTKSVITDQTGAQFQDACVAAILNQVGASLNPKDPNSYICVGKRSTVNVSGIGLITETAVPYSAVPAGTCTAIACSAYDMHNQSSCFAANNLTSLNGQTLENGLSQSQSPTITPDNGISTFTLNDNGTVAAESPGTTATLNATVGAHDTSGLSSDAEKQLESLSQGASAQPSGAQSVPFSGNPDLTDVAQRNTAAGDTAFIGQTQSEAPVQTFASSQTTFTDFSQSAHSTDQAANNTVAEDSSAPAPWYQRLGSAVTNGTTSLVNDVRGWFGLSPLGQPEQPTGPIETMGIRG